MNVRQREDAPRISADIRVKTFPPKVAVQFLMSKRSGAATSCATCRALPAAYGRGPAGVQPLDIAIAEIDPRKRLWQRASEALHVHGYEWPLGPYPEARSFTLFVELQTAGDSAAIPEACNQVSAKDYYLSIRIKLQKDAHGDSQTVLASTPGTVVDVAKRIIAYLRKS